MVLVVFLVGFSVSSLAAFMILIKSLVDSSFLEIESFGVDLAPQQMLTMTPQKINLINLTKNLRALLYMLLVLVLRKYTLVDIIIWCFDHPLEIPFIAVGRLSIIHFLFRKEDIPYQHTQKSKANACKWLLPSSGSLSLPAIPALIS
ncbi:hypothetical protein BpHYR1_006846 [Brachionus plicatilis]|uniref:Uncharacterized protein n=1 Tax=Brachionus plicatilis TaxID=10195 RepID=A0A3M7P9C3_BRAPC|nr:hypothetical protein BpHYR1_006846 [Brachionus plicatilis]